MHRRAGEVDLALCDGSGVTTTTELGNKVRAANWNTRVLLREANFLNQELLPDAISIHAKANAEQLNAPLLRITAVDSRARSPVAPPSAELRGGFGPV